MKPGITQLCLKRTDLEDDLRYVRDTGYEAIELVFSDTGVPSIDASAQELANIRAACDRFGLEISAILPTRRDAGSLLSPDVSERDKRIRILERGLEIAASIGVGALLLHPGALEASSSYETTWNHARDALKTLGPEAERRKCVIGVENVWNKFLLSPRETRQFVDEIGSPGVGVYLDTANMIFYGFAEMWVRELRHRIVRVHVKDFRRRDTAWVQLMNGDVAWPEVMRELRATGFDGALTSEVGGDEATMRETALRIRQIMTLG
ncbi:MAG: sugar phosphate isomerase/epimerase [candidate division Zixibacteria bacterium]|nr:sugar phosphate isomerase/epimerase [candidate division Zixibacteria bacterium]